MYPHRIRLRGPWECEVIGRVPKDVPKVTWSVTTEVTNGLIGTIQAKGKQLIGHVDNSAYPLITVDIQLTLTTLAAAKGPVPVIMEFGFGGRGLGPPPGSGD